MPTPPLSESVLSETLDAFAAHGSINAAAAALGMPPNSFRSRLSRAQAWSASSGYKSQQQSATRDTFEASGDKAEICKTTTRRVRSLQDLIEVCQIDTDEWEVDKWTCGSYEGQSKDNATSAVTVTQMFTVRATLKRNRPLMNAKAEIAALFQAAAKTMPARRVSTPRNGSADIMTTVEVFDLHLGKLAWGRETGQGDYDMSIASRRFKACVESLLQRTSHIKTSKILFPFGNDFLHADNKRGTTTNGTPLDMDSRYVKFYIAGRELLCWALERCLDVAPVEAIAVPGNHDRQSTHTLGDSLSCYFRNTKHVTIDNAPTVRKYRQHGKVMLLYVHGEAGKLKELPLQMATEQPVMFGATVFREAHTGHLHGEQAYEYKGVKVRVSPALCDPDYWHSEGQYTGNLLASEAYVWHRHEGPIVKAFYTASPQ